MTDTGGRSAPQIPIFRIAFDAYRLGLGAIFTSARMFRFFLYGLVISAVVVGGIRYFRLSGIPYVLTRDSAWQAEFDFTIENSSSMVKSNSACQALSRVSTYGMPLSLKYLIPPATTAEITKPYKKNRNILALVKIAPRPRRYASKAVRKMGIWGALRPPVSVMSAA